MARLSAILLVVYALVSALGAALIAAGVIRDKLTVESIILCDAWLYASALLVRTRRRGHK